MSFVLLALASLAKARLSPEVEFLIRVSEHALHRSQEQGEDVEDVQQDVLCRGSRIRFPTNPYVQATLLQNASAAHLPVNNTILRERVNALALQLCCEELKW